KKNSKQTYKDLYNPSNSDNSNSEIFLSLIIKYVFVSNKEYTQANAIWIQAIQKLNAEDNEDNTVLQKGSASSSASFLAISEAAVQENYDELS
ncbi:13699_t:CDS:2, partial [Racocetra persica]